MKTLIVIFLVAVGLWLLWSMFWLDALACLGTGLAFVILIGAFEWWER